MGVLKKYTNPLTCSLKVEFEIQTTATRAPPITIKSYNDNILATYLNFQALWDYLWNHTKNIQTKCTCTFFHEHCSMQCEDKKQHPKVIVYSRPYFWKCARLILFFYNFFNLTWHSLKTLLVIVKDQSSHVWCISTRPVKIWARSVIGVAK